MTDVTPEWITALPKAEIHVHLEGCVPHDLVLPVARARGIEPPVAVDDGPRIESLAELLAYLDFSCALVDDPGLVESLAYQAAQRSHRNGVRYVDMIFNPSHWEFARRDLNLFVRSLDRGFSAAEADGLTPVQLCLSIGRHQSASEAVELVDWLTESEVERVVGLSIDGNEVAAGRSSPRFADAFAKASDRGLRRAVHAGESSGAEGVRDALEFLKPERIDHGIRAITDPRLVADLAAQAIPLAICPTSNVTLGVIDSMDVHPIDRLRKSGVPVCINTDDPLLLDCDVVSEYSLCAETFAWSRADVTELAATSVRVSFAPEELKQEILRDLAAMS